MRILLAVGTFSALLMTWLHVHAADSPCSNLPQGSISRSECERNIAKRKQEEEIRESQKQWMDIQLSTVDKYTCRGEGSPSISNVQQDSSGAVTGTYRNIGSREARGVKVYFELYNQRSELVGRVEAPVFPGTLAPGDTGTFGARLPSPAWGYWSCFRYVVTELADWYTK